MKGEPTSSKEAETAARHTLVTFRLGHGIYALPNQAIIQILPMVTITPLPEIGDPVAGVINVRGQVVPVVDMRAHLGLGAAAYRLYTPIVLARVDENMVGLVVDEVLDVLDLQSSALISPVDILPADLGQAPVLQALAHISGGLALMLAPEHLFKPEQKEALVRAAELLPHLDDAGAAGAPEPAPESSQ